MMRSTTNDREQATREHQLFEAAAEKTPVDRFSPNCYVCQEDLKFPFLRAACGHYFCPECLQFRFEVAFQGVDSWPAQCCDSPFLLGDHLLMQGLVGEGMVAQYQHLVREFGITAYKPEERVYCGQKDCAALIPKPNLDYRGGAAACTRCQKTTCLKCKSPQHDGECPKDPQEKVLLQLAEKKGWKRCPECSTMVDKVCGCNHVRCTCGAHFCYSCGYNLDSCKCETVGQYVARMGAALW